MREASGGWMCQRLGANGRPEYVEAVPGDGGVDWGYTGDPKKAILVSDYWKRRFLADMRRVDARGINAVPLFQEEDSVRVYFPEWAKTRRVALNASTRAVLNTLKCVDGVWCCGHKSAQQKLEPYLLP